MAKTLFLTVFFLSFFESPPVKPLKPYRVFFRVVLTPFWGLFGPFLGYFWTILGYFRPIFSPFPVIFTVFLLAIWRRFAKCAKTSPFSAINHLFCFKNVQNRCFNLWNCAVGGSWFWEGPEWILSVLKHFYEGLDAFWPVFGYFWPLLTVFFALFAAKNCYIGPKYGQNGSKMGYFGVILDTFGSIRCHFGVLKKHAKKRDFCNKKLGFFDIAKPL